MARIFTQWRFSRSPIRPDDRPGDQSIAGISLASFANTDAEVYPSYSWCLAHTYTYTLPRRSQFFPDLRGGDLRARRCPAAKIPGGDFLGSLARESIASAACEIALGVLFPFPRAVARARFPLDRNASLSSLCRRATEAATRDRNGQRSNTGAEGDGYALYHVTVPEGDHGGIERAYMSN